MNTLIICLVYHSYHLVIHSYKQAPYQDCDEKMYKELLNKMPKIVDWSLLGDYEKTDMTIGSQELFVLLLVVVKSKCLKFYTVDCDV